MGDFKNKIPPTRLALDDLPDLSPLSIRWLGEEIKLNGFQADGRLSIHLPKPKLSRTFVFEYKKDWTARPFSAAIAQAREYAQLTNDLPLVILPYLSDQQLDALYEAEVSGMDLCGNAFFYDKKGLMLRFTGKPNLFKSTQVLKSPYQGKSGLVARTLIDCPVLSSAEELREEVRKRGGDVSQPMISRALKAFRDDLIVGSQGEHSIVLLQPEKLLDRLSEQWRVIVERWKASGNTVLWSGRVEGEPDDFVPKIFDQAHEQNLIVTGLRSHQGSINLTTEPVTYLYAERVGSLFNRVQAERTRRFPNLEIWTPPDEAVFFDAKTDRKGMRAISILQAYLEGITGDVRYQGVTEMWREGILHSVNSKKDALLKSGDAA